MSESMDELLARHTREINAKVAEIAAAAYQRGAAHNGAMDSTSISAIHGAVAAGHGIKPAAMLGRSRVREIVRARQEAFARAKDAGHTLESIGRYFGGFDHSTVGFGIRAHNERRETT